MAEIRTPDTRAIRCEDIDEVDRRPGAFEYYRAGERYPAGLIYNCPCGCGARGSLAFRPHPAPSWQWDGNVEQPSLTPSVNHVGHWHGFLTRGVWTHRSP